MKYLKKKNETLYLMKFNINRIILFIAHTNPGTNLIMKKIIKSTKIF